MKGHTKYLIILGLAWCLPSQTSWAGNVTIPNTFVSGNKAVAQEVNSNFSAVAEEINDNNLRIAHLEKEIANLKYFITLLQNDLNVAYNKIEQLEYDMNESDTSRTELHQYLKRYGYLPGS